MGLNNCKDRVVTNGSTDAFVEDIVCQESEIAENGMKVCDLGTDGGKVLLIKQNGVINAIGTKCSHYGAPLSSGALGNGRIRCPWHGACFNIKTGDIEDFPGLDSIPCYQVEIESGGGVKVRAKKSDLKSNKILKCMSARDPNNNTTFIIVGGGPAGQICAETLRQEGFTGRLILISADAYPPYDRIKLSKQLDYTIDQIKLRPETFYKEHDIELMLSTKAVSLDAKQKLLILNNKLKLNYSSIFIATGSEPRKLTVPGSDLKNVFALRTLSDAEEINKVLTPSSQVVIIGTSFIGMEVAAYCIKKCNQGSVTVIGRSSVPFAESLGTVVGERIARLFTEKGVKLRTGVTIDHLEGDETSVNAAVLSDGTLLPANVVIVGLGTTFASDFLNDSGIAINDNGSVPVNKFLETNCPGIFAGGDIAEAPVFAAGDMKKSIGHWGLAHYHGKIAALNMMSVTTPLKTVPFFWTMLFGISFRYAGYAPSYNDTIVAGDVESLKFACYYCKDDQILAVTTVGVDPLAAQYAELTYNGVTLYKKDISDNPLSLSMIKI
ncbi:apoptosis-inducing factor 3-like isoform X2 [Rhodnius prolixus]|uniref:Rieske domain-containing protein n=2 Tax=Rhodnius TaxID=13248 RepID=T1H8Y0_RHOPR